MLDIYTIYERPIDQPQHAFVVRRWTVTSTGALTPQEMTGHQTLTAARKTIPAGYTKVPRDPSDDAKIVENWL